MFKSLFAGSVALLAATSVFAQASAPVAATVVEVGFFAGLGMFLAGWALVILSVLVLFGLIAEHNQAHGWTVFWLILAAGVAFGTFHISLASLAIGAVAYLVFGLVWSFWRYKRHTDKVVEKNKNETETQKARAIKELHPKQMLGTITAWILVWPVSMVENVVGDLITGIQLLVTKFFRGIYHRVYDAAVGKLMK